MIPYKGTFKEREKEMKILIGVYLISFVVLMIEILRSKEYEDL